MNGEELQREVGVCTPQPPPPEDGPIFLSLCVSSPVPRVYLRTGRIITLSESFLNQGTGRGVGESHFKEMPGGLVLFLRQVDAPWEAAFLVTASFPQAAVFRRVGSGPCSGHSCLGKDPWRAGGSRDRGRRGSGEGRAQLFRTSQPWNQEPSPCRGPPTAASAPWSTKAGADRPRGWTRGQGRGLSPPSLPPDTCPPSLVLPPHRATFHLLLRLRKTDSLSCFPAAREPWVSGFPSECDSTAVQQFGAGGGRGVGVGGHGSREFAATGIFLCSSKKGQHKAMLA